MIKWGVKQGSAHLQRGAFLNVTSFSVSGLVNGSKPAGLIVCLWILPAECDPVGLCL